MELTIPNLCKCPCCNNNTLPWRGNYDICPVCAWEDDGSEDPSEYSEANRISLNGARANFAVFGAISQNRVGNVMTLERFEVERKAESEREMLREIEYRFFPDKPRPTLPTLSEILARKVG